MSDNEDPYAVSSDSEDEEKLKKPPPKINIEGRTAADFQQIKQSLTDQKHNEKNDATREEIESLRQANAEAMAQKKKDFEAGKSSLKEEGEQETGKQLEGVGKENLSSMKQMFEKQQGGGEYTSEQREEIGSLKRSEAERKKILAAFMEEEAKEPPRNCHICDKIVYPVERVVAAKNTYHNVCFKCCKCSKKLTPTTFNSHEGQLFCRAHYNEAVHPELVGSLVDADAEDEYERDDDEFALVSKPKQLASDVVRAGDQTSIGDELAQLRSLKEMKAELENQAKAAANESEERMKDLETIKGQAHSIMNKWKTGDVEKAETKEFSAKDEIEELRRGGTKVADRFREGAHDEEVHKGFDTSELDTKSIAEARRSFLEGSAYQSGPVEKTATDLDEIKRGNLSSFKDRFEKGLAGDEEGHEKTAIDLDIQLKSIKESLGKFNDESQMTPEERAEKKKKEIEEEFLRYKLARKLQDKRQQQTGDEAPSESGEQGNKLDVEIKMAGKARERFHELEAQSQQEVPLPGKKAQSPSKWDKKDEGSTAEIVNRRIQDDSEPEDEEFDVKHLMNKFKNIAETAPSHMHKKLEELEALRVEAKNLRQRFEQAGGDEDAEAEQKRRELEAEFARLKEERERAHAELEAERAAEAEARAIEGKEDVQIAADHASKMAAKWEKIQKKEAKKAEKMKMPQKN